MKKTDLDQSKPYGTVFGTGYSYLYVQDERFFDSDGSEVHENGEPVTTQEKIERRRKEIDGLEVQKKKMLQDEMKKLSDQQAEIQEEANKIYIKDAAKKIHAISDKMDDLRTAKDYRDALDMLEFPYDPAATKGDLVKTLEAIIEAAG